MDSFGAVASLTSLNSSTTKYWPICASQSSKRVLIVIFIKNRQEEGDSKVQKIGSCGSRTHFQLVMSKLLDR